MNGRASKNKGSNAEREIVKLARKHYLDAERAYASNGRALGHAETCDVTIQNTPWQIKRRNKIATYIKPPAGTIGTLVREDRGQWLAVLPAHILFDLLHRTGIEIKDSQ
ncbi:MAG: hypothetical protein RI554_11400 [Trueperaceae bacterium]|nr:hypothetical protein [Trueperaceae bacterium]